MQTLVKKEKAEQLLSELEKSVESPLVEPDREAISEEERYMLRKVGLRMKPYVLLGQLPNVALYLCLVSDRI